MSEEKKSTERIVYVGDSRIVARKHENVPRDYTAYPGKTEAFVPNFLLKEWMVGAVVVVGFMVLVITSPAPLGYPADPLNGEFIPIPDWYFLFMYQLLKYPYMSDDYIVLATVVFPGLLFGGLALAPFLDRGKERRFYRRPIASALMLLSVAAIVYLTHVSWSFYTSELDRLGIIPEHIDRAQRISEGRELPTKSSADVSIPIVEPESEGYSIYERSTCISCHATDLKGEGNFPPLLGIGDKYDKEQIMQIVINGKGSGMPPSYEPNIQQGLTEEEIDTMVEWLAMQKAAP